MFDIKSSHFRLSTLTEDIYDLTDHINCPILKRDSSLFLFLGEIFSVEDVTVKKKYIKANREVGLETLIFC